MPYFYWIETVRRQDRGPQGQLAFHPAIRYGTHRFRSRCVMAWIYLLIAGLLEIGWAIGLKFSDGFSRLWPSLATIVAMILSLGFLALAIRELPVGTAYAMWTGIGTVGTVMLGISLFGEPANAARLACMGLIFAGIIGLKLAA
jgi:quaternary ammonium compound-resistance protein SugE